MTWRNAIASCITLQTLPFKRALQTCLPQATSQISIAALWYNCNRQ
ncbi:MAG: hypothetical protein KME45_08320 [Stenomitos rutilans HA7619-LM2]|nr:hypothetical protein [Stenomitos rutilans HA7619-LM2]